MINKENQLFTSFIRQYQAGLRSFIRGLGVNADAVDDIAQETFMVAYRELEKFDQALDFGHWLRGIARNIIRNELRKHARQCRVMNEKLTQFLIDEFEFYYEPSAYDDDHVKALNECLGQLSDKNKQMIAQKYHDETSTQILAKQLKMSTTAVRLALMRIRKALKKCVDSRLGYE